MKTVQRRSAFKKIFASMLGLTGVSAIANAATKQDVQNEKVCNDIVMQDDVPLFSSSTTFGGMVFLAGIGAHFEGDIKAHTDHVLKEMEKQLIKANSSMDKVLKVNVYLADLNDYKGLNEVFRGRFGPNPPVRTTVATYGGVPGNSLVEMDCIAIANNPTKQ